MVRSGTIEEITQAESQYRIVRVGWVGDGGLVQSTLAANSKISGILLRASEGVCKFAGPEEELADVLRALVTAGVRVVSFGEVKQTVEDLYLKLSRNQVM